MHGRLMAAQIWREHSLRTPVDLRRLTGALGLRVVEFPFSGRLKEVIIDGVIGVRPGLPRAEFRWLVAHATGHHLLHVGASFYLQDWQWVNRAKAERQAEEFAACLLGGPDGWRLSAPELGIPGAKLPLVAELTRQSPLP